jgi:hypothetical protein
MIGRVARSMVAVFILLAAGLGHAQSDGPYWTTIPIPAGMTAGSTKGAYAWFRTASSMTFFSAFRRTFTTVPASAAATVSAGDYWCVIRDGTSFTAYVARTGFVSTIIVPGGYMTNSTPSIAFVADGQSVWAISAFGGGWVPLTVPGSVGYFATADTCALISAGSQVHAFSAYSGTWTSYTPTEPIQWYWAGGAVGMAAGATTVFAYSAYRQHWVSYPFSGTTSFAIWISGNIGVCFRPGISTGYGDPLFFSAMTETFAQPVTMNATVEQYDNLAVVRNATGILLFPAATGVLVSWPFVPGSNGVITNRDWVLVTEPGGLRAFSGFTGAAAPVAGNFWNALNTADSDTVLAMSGPLVGGTGLAYSPYVNAWAATPSTVGAGQACLEGFVLAHIGSYDAYSARTGTWSSIQASSVSSYQTLGGGHSIAWVLDGTSMSVFDSRLGRWSTITAAAAPAVSMNGPILIAHDGTTAYGFSLMTGVWATVPLSGVPVAMGTGQSIGSQALGAIQTTTHLYFYAAPGSLSTWADLPEGRGTQPRGAQFRMTQIGPPGSLVTAAVSPAGGFTPVPPWGTAFLDLNALVGFFDIGSVPASGALDYSMLLPNDPALNDMPVWIQDVVYPLASPAYITNAIAPIIL